MNLDQRLEALVQSVELLAAMQKDTEKRMGQLVTAVGRVDERRQSLEVLVTQIAEGTARLLNVVQDHEERITGLEQNQNPQ